MVGRHSWKVGNGLESFQRAGSGWEALPVGWLWQKRPLEGPGVVGKHFRRVESGQEALPEGWQWSSGHPGGREWSVPYSGKIWRGLTFAFFAIWAKS